MIKNLRDHADQIELLGWHAHTGNPKTTSFVYDEEDSMQVFVKKLKNTRVKIPALHQTYHLELLSAAEYALQRILSVVQS